MRLFIKFAIAALLFGLLLIISGLLLIQYSPQSILSLSQHFSSYHVTAEKMDIDLIVPSINISGLQLNVADENAIALETFTFSTSWQSLRGNSQEWEALAKNGVIHLNKLGQSKGGTSSETAAPNVAKLHNMLQKANITVENIVLNVTDTTSTKLEYLRRLERQQEDVGIEEQGVEFSLTYNQNAVTLGLEGSLLSRINNGQAEITLNLPLVDLRAIMSAKDKNSGQPLATTDETRAYKEAAIDWTPLSQLTPLNVLFQSEKIRLPQGDISNIRSRMTFTNTEGVRGIEQEHTANLNLKINNDITVEQAATLRANWIILGEKTSGSDINGNTVISLGDNNISVAGKMNINGINEQYITLTTDIKNIPVKSTSKRILLHKKELEQRLPLKANIQLKLQKGHIALNNVDVKANNSTVNGNLAIKFDQGIMDLRSVVFDINSTRLTIPKLETAQSSSTPNTSSSTTSLNWLNKVKIDGKVNLGKVIYNNETLLKNARTQLSLQNKKIILKDININTKDSDVAGNLSLSFDKDISDLRDVTFDIRSTKLVIPSPDKNTAVTNTPTSSNNLPVEWLNNIKAKGSINIGEVIYKSETVLSSAQTTIALNKNQLLLSDLAATAKGSDINGKITVDINKKETHLYAVNFDLNSEKIVVPDAKTTSKKAGNSPTSQKKITLFTSDTLPTDWLKTVKAEGKLSIAKVIRNNETLITNADSHISLDKNILKLNSQIGNIAGGQSDVNLSIDNTENTLAIVVNANAKNIVLEKLALVPKDELSGGTSDINLSLSSYGLSTKALANHLQGNLLFTAKEGVIANNTFEAIGSDVLLKLLNSINPFYKSTKTTNLECAVVNSKIIDGKMLFDNSIAIKTSKMIIIADGEIDLTTEQINLGINPKARQGVGIDVASLAKFVAVQGPLTKPSVGISGTGTAKSLLSIGAAISTGGLSLLATKLADAVISGDPCEVAKNAFTNKPDSTNTSAAAEK